MGETPPLPLPEHPELRELAQALEEAGVAAEILDHKWRVVYTTSEDALGLGLDPAEMHHHYGLSLITRPDHHPDWVTDRETGSRWWRAVGPHMVRDVRPDDPDFDEVFGRLAPRARLVRAGMFEVQENSYARMQRLNMKPAHGQW